MNADDVAKEICRRAWSFGVSVILSPADYLVADGCPVSGYFDSSPETPVLAVAWGATDQRRIGTLLHEYCHLTQWAEDAPVWRNDGSSAWADWLAGKRVAGVQQAIINSRELEADCERRTLRLIKEMAAPVDCELYCRAANSYVHFYNVMAARRKWYAKGRGPYDVPEVLAAANPAFDKDFSKTPRKLWAEIEKCLP